MYIFESWSASGFNYWYYYWLIRNSLSIWSPGNGEISRFVSHHIVWTLWKRNEESPNGSDRYLYWYASIAWMGWPVASSHVLSLPSVLTLLKRNEARNWASLSLQVNFLATHLRQSRGGLWLITVQLSFSIVAPLDQLLPSFISLLRFHYTSLGWGYFSWLSICQKPESSLVDYCSALFFYCGSIGRITVQLYFSAAVSLHVRWVRLF
jgi:hypothetical protein